MDRWSTQSSTSLFNQRIGTFVGSYETYSSTQSIQQRGIWFKDLNERQLSSNLEVSSKPRKMLKFDTLFYCSRYEISTQDDFVRPPRWMLILWKSPGYVWPSAMQPWNPSDCVKLGHSIWPKYFLQCSTTADTTCPTWLKTLDLTTSDAATFLNAFDWLCTWRFQVLSSARPRTCRAAWAFPEFAPGAWSTGTVVPRSNVTSGDFGTFQGPKLVCWSANLVTPI